MIRPPPITSARQYQELLHFLWGVLSVPWPPGTRLTSWHRTTEENRRVGGHPRSQHLLGLALDVVVPGGDPAGDAQLSLNLQRAGVVPIREATHLHVQRFRAGVADSIGLYADDVGTLA